EIEKQATVRRGVCVYGGLTYNVFRHHSSLLTRVSGGGHVAGVFTHAPPHLFLAALPPFLRDALHEARDRFWNRLRPAFPLRDRHRVDTEGFSHLDLGERQALANPFQFLRLHG